MVRRAGWAWNDLLGGSTESLFRQTNAGWLARPEPRRMDLWVLVGATSPLSWTYEPDSTTSMPSQAFSWASRVEQWRVNGRPHRAWRGRRRFCRPAWHPSREPKQRSWISSTGARLWDLQPLWDESPEHGLRGLSWPCLERATERRRKPWMEAMAGWLLQSAWPLHVTAGWRRWRVADHPWMSPRGTCFRLGVSHACPLGQVEKVLSHRNLPNHDLVNAPCHACVLVVLLASTYHGDRKRLVDEPSIEKGTTAPFRCGRSDDFRA